MTSLARAVAKCREGVDSLKHAVSTKLSADTLCVNLHHQDDAGMQEVVGPLQLMRDNLKDQNTTNTSLRMN